MLEAIQGCRNKIEAKKVERILGDLIIVFPNEAAYHRALDEFPDQRLKNGLSALDLLIGVTTAEADATLLTFNRKHFSGIPGLRIEEPYVR